MRDQDANGNRRQRYEDDYLGTTDRELTKRTSHQAELDSQRERMAEASGIWDREILEDLQELGYMPDTVTLLRLTPVIEVAWADGQVTNSERAMILGMAAIRNVEWESPAYHQLLEWIARRPSREFFQKSRSAIRSAWRALPSGERTSRQRDLISSCRNVAWASRGVLDVGPEMCDEERHLIDELALELQPDDDAPITGVVA